MGAFPASVFERIGNVVAASVSGAPFLIRKILETTEQRYFKRMFGRARISLYENEARMDEPIIAEHALKHGLLKEEIEQAWNHPLVVRHRISPNEGEIVAVGQTLNGGLVELVAARQGFVTIIFHAMKPPPKKVLLELGLIRRKR